MRVLVATNNAKKRKELDSILHALGVETVTPAELGINCEVEETGETFEENAMLKAKNGAILAGIPAIADDSGLMVDALGGRPGVYSRALRRRRARRCRPNAASALRTQGRDGARRKVCERHRLLRERRRLFHRARRVRGPHCGRASWRRRFRGTIPIFYVPEYGMTYSEMDPELKNRISHRGVALARFCERLKQTREKDGSQ